MTARVRIFTFFIFYLFSILFAAYVDCQSIDVQLCHMCGGSVDNHSAVWSFCQSKGKLVGRCCFPDEEENILGLDLSNCSLTQVGDLHVASTALIIDLSSNPISSMSDLAFQGFKLLNHLILPLNLDCPGGNTSWDRVEAKHDTRLCEGQRNVCNQTAQMASDCPENSVCMPYGPGFFECMCLHSFHGYKCLREDQFPMLEVMAILGTSTVVISLLLWITQRRKIQDTRFLVPSGT